MSVSVCVCVYEFVCVHDQTVDNDTHLAATLVVARDFATRAHLHAVSFVIVKHARAHTRAANKKYYGNYTQHSSGVLALSNYYCCRYTQIIYTRSGVLIRVCMRAHVSAISQCVDDDMATASTTTRRRRQRRRLTINCATRGTVFFAINCCRT